jgi:transmembrane protein 17
MTRYKKYVVIVKFVPGNEIVSSLPLQMSLYFNIVYFPFWLYTFVSLILIKVSFIKNKKLMRYLIRIKLIFSLVV